MLDAHHQLETRRVANDRSPTRRHQLLLEGRHLPDDRESSQLGAEAAVARLLTFDVVGDELDHIAGGNALRVGGAERPILHGLYHLHLRERLLQQRPEVHVERVGEGEADRDGGRESERKIAFFIDQPRVVEHEVLEQFDDVIVSLVRRSVGSARAGKPRRTAGRLGRGAKRCGQVRVIDQPVVLQAADTEEPREVHQLIE